MFISKFTLCCLLSSSIVYGLKWEDCGSPGRAVTFQRLDIEGDEIIMDGTKAMIGDVSATINRALDSNVQIDVDLSRIVQIWLIGEQRIPIPCFSSTCSYSLCQLIDYQQDIALAFSLKPGVPIKCPLEPRTYSAKVRYLVESNRLDQIPSMIRSMFSVSLI